MNTNRSCKKFVNGKLRFASKPIRNVVQWFGLISPTHQARNSAIDCRNAASRPTRWRHHQHAN